MNTNGLQQRLKSPRDSQSNGGPARTARGARKKGGSRSRRSNPNRAALVATSLFICVVIPLVLLVNKATRGGGGGGGARSAAGGPASDRFVEDWRPSGAKAGGRPAAGGNNKRGAAGPDAEARRRARAERHESLYRPKFGEDELGFDIYDCPDRPPEGYPGRGRPRRSSPAGIPWTSPRSSRTTARCTRESASSTTRPSTRPRCGTGTARCRS